MSKAILNGIARVSCCPNLRHRSRQNRLRLDLLRKAFRYGMPNHPFKIDVIAILPDHLHCIWTLPENDADFSTRWRLIKSYFSRYCNLEYQGKVSDSRQKKAEKAVWQRRFWEHQIQDDDDFTNHLNYIHYNPVSHGFAVAPKHWPFSSFRVM